MRAFAIGLLAAALVGLVACAGGEDETRAGPEPGVGGSGGAGATGGASGGAAGVSGGAGGGTSGGTGGTSTGGSGAAPPACVHDCVEMIWIPPGTFEMGADGVPGESNPRHEVTLTKGFFIDKYEVSAKRFQPCIAAGVCSTPGGSFNPDAYPDRAVYGISWELARQYCEWTGKRLPTEAEWERAASGDGERCYPWGGQKQGSDCTEKPDCSKAAHCLESLCANGPCYNKPQDVSAFESQGNLSAFGVVNMAGNVWEWVQDTWIEDFDWCTSGCTDPISPSSDTRHVMKGGSWISEEVFLRCAARYHDGDGGFPEFEVGIRCAADAP